ncbi:MAG: hypothetical protein AABO41_15110 [Acidobacteriota bacterium]
MLAAIGVLDSPGDRAQMEGWPGDAEADISHCVALALGVAPGKGSTDGLQVIVQLRSRQVRGGEHAAKTVDVPSIAQTTGRESSPVKSSAWHLQPAGDGKADRGFGDG